MSADFNITSEVHNESLVMKTDGYINNVAGEKILDEFSKSFTNGMNKLVIDLEKSKVVNSIGISYLIDIMTTNNTADMNKKVAVLFFEFTEFPHARKVFFKATFHPP